MSTMTDNTETGTDPHLELASAHRERITREVRDLAEAHAAVPEDAAHRAIGAAEIVFNGKLNSLSVSLAFTDGTKLHFSGSGAGLGAGQGKSYGAASFSVAPEQLVGAGAYDIAFFNQDASGVVITFTKNLATVGVFTGAGLGVEGQGCAGAGKWSKVS